MECSSDDEELNSQQDKEVVQHSSYKQVMLDVNRCAGRLERMRQVYFHRIDDYNQPSSIEDLADGLSDDEPNLDHSDSSIEVQSITSQDVRSHNEIKKKLARLIVRLLMKKPNLHYYQGFHDVCLTYLILLGDDKEAEEKLDQMIDSHFNVYMQPTMNETQESLAQVPIIIGLMDPKVEEFLEKAEIGTIFALSWVITWFSHVISNEQDVEKIYRFLESEDPHMVLYLSAALVISKKDLLLKLEPEMSTVHHYLSQLPRREKFDFENLFDHSRKAFEEWPPEFVKEKLEKDRRLRLYQVNNYNLIRRLADNLFQPYWNRFIVNHPRATYLFRTLASPLEPFANSFAATNPRTAIIVMVVASALIFQIDKWAR